MAAATCSTAGRTLLSSSDGEFRRFLRQVTGEFEAMEPGFASDLICHLCCRDVKRVLFVPYALHDRDAYTKTARDMFRTLGLSRLFAVSG